MFVCETCSKTFTECYNLRKHVKKFHVGVPVPPRNKPGRKASKNLKTDNKDKKARRKYGKRLRIPSEQLTFPNYKAFLDWRYNEEANSQFKFTKLSGNRLDKFGNKKQYFGCHRSGFFVPKGKGKRRIKTQGSCKINAKCPASMKVITANSGSVTVYYVNEHKNHNFELAHMTLNRLKRREIAEKLAAGIPLNSVLESIQKHASSENNILVAQLTKRQFLENIVRDFHISKGFVQHSSDTKAWNEKCKELSNANCLEKADWVNQFLYDFAEKIKCHFQQNPTAFLHALEKMNGNIQKYASTETGLLTALATFGEFSTMIITKKKSKTDLDTNEEATATTKKKPAKRKNNFENPQLLQQQPQQLQQLPRKKKKVPTAALR